MSSKKRECIPEVHPFSRISVEKASLETRLDAAVYLIEDIPVKCGSGVEVVFKMKSDLVKCHFLLLPRAEINQRERHMEVKSAALIGKGKASACCQNR